MSQETWNPLEHLDEVRELSSLGLSERNMASKLNVHPDSFRHFRKNIPEFDKAVVDGLNSTIIIAAIELKRLIHSGDFKAIKFFLEKKGGWGDAPQSTITLPNIGSFNLVKVVKEQDKEHGS